MNATQRAEVIGIIEKDCQITGLYVCNGETCAIGALALAAGIPKERFGRNEHCNQMRIFTQTLLDVAMITAIRFGLSIGNLSDIQVLNDESHAPELRRKKIIAFLDTLPLETD